MLNMKERQTRAATTIFPACIGAVNFPLCIGCLLHTRLSLIIYITNSLFSMLLF